MMNEVKESEGYTRPNLLVEVGHLVFVMNRDVP